MLCADIRVIPILSKVHLHLNIRIPQVNSETFGHLVHII